MKILRTVNELQLVRKNLNGSVGFVPTMGALHAGHASLGKRARKENDFVIFSIFVNPTQFNNPQDLQKYPQTLECDIALLTDLNVDFLFLPNFSELYPDQYAFKVSESSLSQKWCGAHRPGHFDGVLTVVMRLLNLTAPHRAYFGEKDFQQLSLIQKMVAAFFMPVEIIGCLTIREADGLAMSSRNARLNAEQRSLAAILPRILMQFEKSLVEIKNELTEKGFVVDYVDDISSEFETRRLAAVHLGEVRLIDNVIKSKMCIDERRIDERIDEKIL